MDKLENLAFFIRLAEKKGVAAAGRDFGMSAATASERLSMLETHYGAKLVNRTTRALRLTDEGRILLKGARGLVNDSEELASLIRHGITRVSGRIRISAPQDLGSLKLGSFLDDFQSQHPDVQVELLLGDRHLDLVAEGVDIAIRLGQMRDSSLRIRKLADNRRVLVAAPSYLNARGTPSHPDQLEGHNCLIMHWGHVIDREWVFKVKGRKKTIVVSGDRASNNGLQVKRWCLDGHGLALKSIWDVHDAIESGELVEVLSDYQYVQQSALQLLYPGGGVSPQRVRMLIEHLATCFEAQASVVQG